MFKKALKMTLALAIIIGGSAYAMQKPIQGKATIGLTPAQKAAQRERYAQLIQQAETKKAAAKAKVAQATTPAERAQREKMVAEAETFARRLREEQAEQNLDEAIVMPLPPASAGAMTPPPVPARAAVPAATAVSPDRLPGYMKMYTPLTGTYSYVPVSSLRDVARP